MDKVFHISDRIQEKKIKQRKKTFRKKFESVERIVLCSSCHFKCAMCGYHINTKDSESTKVSDKADFDLCENCRAEFEDFQKAIKGEKPSDMPWHNTEWIRLWSTWLEYQTAIRKFKGSGEFRQSSDLLVLDE